MRVVPVSMMKFDALLVMLEVELMLTMALPSTSQSARGETDRVNRHRREWNEIARPARSRQHAREEEKLTSL